MFNKRKILRSIWPIQLILTICLISNVAAEEKWSSIFKFEKNGNEIFLLNEPPVILDSSIRVWVLTNFPSSNFSMIEYLEYDCNESKIKPLERQVYKNLMGKGSTLDLKTKGKGEWRYAMPNSPAEQIRKSLCSAFEK